MQTARERSRWLLTDGDIERFLGATYNATMETLADDQALARSLDPSGHRPLRQAKQMRRAEILKGAWYDQDMLVQVAEQHFALPSQLPGYFKDSTIVKPWDEQRAQSTVQGAQGDDQ
jgi:hypothetical protein